MRPEQLGTVFARNLAAARRRAGLSQRALAAQLGTQSPQISNWENGRTSPTLDTIARIASALHVSPEVLLTEIGSEILETVSA